MKFEYKKEVNIEEGQLLFGIIGDSRVTYNGVFPIVVYSIDYNDEEVIFEVDMPCGYVSCTFEEMGYLVFETKEEAIEMSYRLDPCYAMFAYNW